MPRKKSLVTPTPDEPGHRADLLREGNASALVPTRGRIRPKAYQARGRPAREDAAVAEEPGVGLRTTGRVRERFGGPGLEDGPRRKTRDQPSRVRTPDGTAGAKPIDPACPDPPDDRAAWAVQARADGPVEPKVADATPDETVRRAMKSARSARGSGSSGASRPARAGRSSRRWGT